MSKITQPKVREIIEDFAKEIRAKKDTTTKPSKHVINFRNDIANNNERDVVQVPINLLRFRKDNGRIASNVLDYEHEIGPLDESDQDTQEKLGSFLKEKDPEKRLILMKSLQHAGQIEPAIITCDGFLINGNRRKLAMEDLLETYPNKDEFKYMRAVILPGIDDEGGPPTLLEIERLENRYQLQSDGRAEYYGFDRALSIRRKINTGLSLKEQVTDDPQHAGKNEREINQAVKNIQKEYLNPLKCVDRYLKQFEREKQYHTISAGAGDREGRWQAFIDYSNKLDSKFHNPTYLAENRIREDEIGDFEEAAFNIIRLRNIPGMPKVHKIMRDLNKNCAIPKGQNEILNISEKVEPLSNEEHYKDDDQKIPLSRKDVDAKWAAKNQQTIIFHLKRAMKDYETQQEKETPIELLDAALKKLRHRDMKLEDITTGDYDRARKLTSDIQKEANNLVKKIYEQKKKLKKLTKKAR